MAKPKTGARNPAVFCQTAFGMDGLTISPTLTQTPFAVVTLIAAPALLTNSCSLLALGTINRMLRTRDRMTELYRESETPGRSEEDQQIIVEKVNRVEQQAFLLLRGLLAIYVALGAFICATLVTLVGAGLTPYLGGRGFNVLAACGLILGAVGVGGLVFGCVNLFRATQSSVVNLRLEARMIRERWARHQAALKEK